MIKFLLFVLIISLTTNCESLRKGLGIDKDAPDEFFIKKSDPIQAPPNYDLLPPDSNTKSRKYKSSKSARDILDENLKNNKIMEEEGKIEKKESKILEDEIIKRINNK